MLISCKGKVVEQPVILPTPTPAIVEATPTPVVVKLVYCHHAPMICPSPMPPPMDLTGKPCEKEGEIRGCDQSVFECKKSCD